MVAPHVIAPDGVADLGAAMTTIRGIAANVPDPELVVVTVGDLGILRDVRVVDNQFVLDVTPTYSACPATLAIELEIETAVRNAGYDARANRVLAPAWTTNWISDEGRAKLKASGIAPPALSNNASGNASGKASGKAGGDLGYFDVQIVACPRCDSERTSQLAAFGSTACKAQYRCDSCYEPFDYFKCL